MRPIGGIGVKVSEERLWMVDEAGVVYGWCRREMRQREIWGF